MEIKALMHGGGRRKLAVYPPERDQEGLTTRKYIFKDTDMKCLIYTKSRNNLNNKRGKVERDTDVLFLKQEGKTYAELLRTFKEKVKPNTEGGRAIRSIREGKDGRMLVVLQKNNEETVKQINKDIGEVMQVTKGINREDVAVYIYDLDSITTAEEVKKTISETVNEDEKIKVGEPRNMARGNRAVTAFVPKEVASKLLNTQGIKVGLN